MKKWIKYLPLDFYGRLYNLFKIKKFAKEFLPDDFDIRVLCYHDVTEKDLASFERQVAFLKEEYNIIDTQKLRDFFLGRGFLPGLNIFLTFDDSSVDQYLNAAPILDRYGVKACFFICTGDIEKREFIISRPGSNLRPMQWSQIIDLHKRGHAIGAHTVNHPNLLKLQPWHIYRELIDSKKTLEEKIGAEVDFFAFPHGTEKDISQEALIIAKKIFNFNFIFLSATNNFACANRYLIRRTGINPRNSIHELRALICGVKDFLYKQKIKKLEALLI